MRSVDRETHEIAYQSFVFSDAESSRIETNSAQSLVHTSLEIDTLTAVVKSNSANILNFQANAPVTYSENGVKKAVYYLRSIDRVGASTYQLNATSAIERLAKTQHYGGIYSGDTVDAVVQNICGGVPVIVKSELQEVKLYGWLPIATARDNLAQVLFAVGATVKTDLNGVLRVEPLWDGVSWVIYANRIYSNAKVNYGSRVTQVIVTEHQYIKSLTQEPQQLFGGTAQAGDVITFSEPVYDLTAAGFTIRSSGANYAILGAGNGTLTGTPYRHNTRQISKTISAGGTPNTVKIDQATLVSVVNSANVAERVAKFYRQYETINAAYVARGERPGDVVKMYHPYSGSMVTACFADAWTNMSAVNKTQSEALVGYVPPRPSTNQQDGRVLITSSGTFVTPEGVTQLRVVLIGGGDGGSPGSAGEAGGEGGYGNGNNGAGGAGGQGGKRGAGGKVLEVTVYTTPGAVNQVTIGAGGASGSPGGATIFGAFSSASGASTDYGYVDPITGDTFAIQGAADGEAGGNGGTNGSGSNVTYAGTTYAGGAQGAGVSGAASGGSGGGAAIGSKGEDGGDWRMIGTYRGGVGGAGASATVAGANGTIIGQGGSGGHGGGGGGGGGWGYDQYGGSGQVNDGGAGGAGGAGGRGMPGCAVVYYSQEIERPYGWARDKNGRPMLDMYRRRTIA